MHLLLIEKRCVSACIKSSAMQEYSLTKDVSLEYDRSRDVVARGYHGRGKLGKD